MDYHIHHRVTSVSISDGPSFDPSPFLMICPIDVPSSDHIHGSSNYPSLSRGSSLYPNYLNVVHGISFDMLVINFNESPTQVFVEEQQPLQEPNGVPSSGPRRCTDNLPSLTIGIDSSAPSPEPNHLRKLQLDYVFSMTADYF